VWLVKWILLGRVKPGQHPLWSCWACRWDYLYTIWQHWAAPAMTPLGGTPFLPMWLRTVGANVGDNVVLHGNFVQLVDPDMLTLETGSTVSCLFQAHSFEDRVLKIAPVRIGVGASAMAQTVVMYGSNIDDGATVAPHGVVMKNEHLTAGQYYRGGPCRA
ncbi:hypothetical protein EMIHUDRAFT_47403, partial [Emiliania huxleyi CCMP1516]|uniref:Dynactin subunit 6 n=2 Tax=Emiliania huxleyi TaxID=2903 RepID=A0A0D3K7Z8_EMIH1